MDVGNMEMALLNALPSWAAALSLLLMGICGVKLLWRLTRVLRGQETADGLANPVPHTPARTLVLAACVGLLSRVLVCALAYAMYRVLLGGNASFGNSFEMLWNHWDVRHYLEIARDGYVATGDERLRLVFFPLYPLLMRLTAPLTGGNVYLAGTLLSLVCTAVASALLVDLCYMHGGARTARLGLAYFLLNPMSVFLGCVYTEALFICLTLVVVCLIRRGHPWLAALCGLCSALTRMPGVVVAGLAFIHLLGGVPGRRVNARAIASCAGQMLLVFAGLFIYWGINAAVTGDPLMYMTYQRENWYQEPGTFWQSTRTTMHYFLQTRGDDDWFFTWGFQLLCMFYIYLLLALRQDRLPFDLAAYSFVYVAVVFAPTWLLSGARYLFALCALPLLQARAFKTRWMHALALGISAALLVVFVFGYAIAVEVL